MSTTPQKLYDLREVSVDCFERLFFDRTSDERYWYEWPAAKVVYDPAHNSELFIALFNRGPWLLDQYSRQQLEHGFWAIFGSGNAIDGGLCDLIWRSRIPICLKERLIMSMFYIYKGLFDQDPLTHACEMWWDSLAYDFNPMKTAQPETKSEHRRIQEAMFVTLKRILQLESVACQTAALHGLNHVNHPDTSVLIESFIQTYPELTEHEIEYARACAAGDAM